MSPASLPPMGPPPPPVGPPTRGRAPLVARYPLPVDSMTGGRQGGQGRIDEQGRIDDITDTARDFALQLP